MNKCGLQHVRLLALEDVSTLEMHYMKIKNVDLKFDIKALKKDIQSKTSKLMSKAFKK